MPTQLQWPYKGTTQTALFASEADANRCCSILQHHGIAAECNDVSIVRYPANSLSYSSCKPATKQAFCQDALQEEMFAD